MNSFIEAAVQAGVIDLDSARASWQRVFGNPHPPGGTPWDPVLYREWNERPRASFEQIRDFYEGDTYFVFICSMSGWPSCGLDPLVEPVFRPGTRVLDFGCGHGNAGLACAQRGARTLLADASRRVLRVIDHVARTERLPAETLLVQQTVPALGTEQYDLVSCIDCLEHVQDPLGVLRSLVDATKRGGHLRLSVFFGAHEHAPYHLPQHAELGRNGAFRGICEGLGLSLLQTEPGASDNGLYRRN
jgi:SAM-dependent methyltransferase